MSSSDVDKYMVAKAAVRETVAQFADRVWKNLPDYRDRNIDRLVSLIVPHVQAGQLKVAGLTTAYVARMAQRDGLKFSTKIDRSVLDYRGVDPAEVYRRPATEVYTALSNGSTVSDAIDAGSARLASLVVTDLQQAANRQMQTSMQDAGFAYYKRVLSGAENCALCTIASTQRYTVGNLMPIHPGCDCGCEKVDASFDPGQVLESDLLEDTHARVGEFAGLSDRGGRAPDYRQLIVTREHGELGPTLAWRTDKFTTQADIRH